MVRIKKEDQELLHCLTVMRPANRQAIIKFLDPNAIERLRGHIRALVQGRKKNYKLNDELKEKLSTSLKKHRNTVKGFMNGQYGGGRKVPSLLPKIISALVPVVTSLVINNGKK